MRRTVTRVLLGAAVVSLMTLVVPAAQAAGDTIRGGCFLASAANATVTGGAYVGVMGDASVTMDATGALIAASVTCEILVNGSPIGGRIYRDLPGLIPGVQFGTDQMTFTASPTDVVEVCQQVAYGDGTGSGTNCSAAISAEIPPQQISDAINSIFESIVDPVVCPILAAHSGTYGVVSPPVSVVVTIDPTGDVTVPALGPDPVYDCPPYGSTARPLDVQGQAVRVLFVA